MKFFLKTIAKLIEVTDELFNTLPVAWSSKSIKEINPNIFDWLTCRIQPLCMVLVIMTVVAVLNLITCLIILVLERTRMIGVLKALGSPNASIQRIFLYQGAIITVTGIVLGNLVALLLIWLQQKYSLISLQEEMYYISKVEMRPEWWHFLLVDAGTFIICFLILIIPTLDYTKDTASEGDTVPLTQEFSGIGS